MNMSTQTANLNLSYLVQRQNCLLSTTGNILKSSAPASHDLFGSLMAKNQELKNAKSSTDTAEKKVIAKTICSVLTGSSEQKLTDTLLKCRENESTCIYENVLTTELSMDDADNRESALKNSYKDVGNLLTLMQKSTLPSLSADILSAGTELALLKHLGSHLKNLLNAESFSGCSSSFGGLTYATREIGSVYILIMNLISKDKFQKNEIKKEKQSIRDKRKQTKRIIEEHENDEKERMAQFAMQFMF